MDDIQEYIEIAQRATSPEDLHRLCFHVAQTYDYDSFAYVFTYYCSLEKPQVHIISGYPGDWLDRYVDANYLSIDPIVKHCSRNVTPFKWDMAVAIEKNPQSLQMMRDAYDFGLKSGITIPIHGQQGDDGLMSFSKNQDRSEAAHVLHSLPFLDHLSPYIHVAAYRILIENEEHSELAKVRLTPREKECLLWSAEGKSAWEISKILSISEAGVGFHIQNFCRKLGVTNKRHAVARALSLGLIETQGPIVVKPAHLYRSGT